MLQNVSAYSLYGCCINIYKYCPTWGDLLHQDGGLGGKSESMRVEVWVPLDLNTEAERVIPLIRAAGLSCLPIYSSPISGRVI